MASEFSKQFPKPPPEHNLALQLWKIRREGWLAALKWTLSRQNFYRDVGKMVGTGAASKTIDDIEQEIETVEKESK